jgi:hypothetical protein
MNCGNPFVASVLVGAGLFGLMLGCGTGSEPSTTSTSEAVTSELAACGLNDGSIEPGAHLHACDPQDHEKTTICHIPPGNPANAHTICVGNAAVPAHIDNHGDYLGLCQHETTCPPPATGTAGTGDDVGTAGTGAAGAAGTGASEGTAGSSGSAGSGAAGYVIP